MERMWVMRQGGEVIGIRSTFAKVERTIARRFPRLTSYIADPGEFSTAGGRFVETVDLGEPTPDGSVRVDRLIVDDPTDEP